MEFEVVVEIPKGKRNKYEMDHVTGRIYLDRMLDVYKRQAELFAADSYREYVAMHGLSVEMTEAVAELWHRRVREEWGFADEDAPTLTGLFRQQHRGGRYSFGYPACPDLEDNAKVVDLLEAGRIGVTVSEGFQLHPEQTTLAIICHHPMAKYFVV